MTGLTSTEEEALRLFKGRLQQVFPHQLEEVKLFGSKARGDASGESDVDVLVVLTTGDWRDERAIVNIATGVFVATGVDISPKVYTQSQIADMRRRRTVFLQAVDRDTIPV